MPKHLIRPYLRLFEGEQGAAGGANAGNPDPSSGQQNGGEQTAGDGDGLRKTGSADGKTEGGDAEGGNDEFKSSESKQRVLADLASERDRRQALAQQNEELQAKVKEFEDAKLSAEEKTLRDLEEARAQVAALEEENAGLVKEQWRAQAATTHKLPAGMAGRLRGETQEEIDADAKALAEELGPAGSSSGGPRPDASQGRGAASKPTYTNLSDAIDASYNS